MREIHIPATLQRIYSLRGNNLQNIHVAAGNANYSSEDGLLLSKDKTTLLMYPQGRTATTYTMPNCVKRLAREAVNNNSSLKELYLANVEEMEQYAIGSCTSLETIHVGSNMRDVRYGNFDAPNLLNIYVDGKNKKYQSVDGVLVENNTVLLKYSCGRTATSYVVPEGLTEIGENAIERNEYLTEVVLPSTLKRLQIESILLENLTKISLPESLEQLDGSAIGSGKLKTIHIPAKVKIIGSGVFMNCEVLESITVDENNPYYTAVDGVLYTKSMNCLVQYPNAKKDTEFTVPSKVKSLGLWAFVEVPALKELVLQEGLVLVEECLNELDNLERIVCNTVTPPYVDEENEYMLRGFWEDVILCIPREAHDAYVNHPVWGNFVHIEYITAEGAEMEKEEVEIVEDETSVEITWPKVDGADNYTIVITYQGMPICTLTFNALGQLVNINFERNGAPRAATEGFKFTVTGLDSGTQYAYSVVATAQGEEVKSYTGEFTTLGEATGIEEGVSKNVISVVDGTIVSERGAVTIYNVTGNDVTAQNGNLATGVYVVSVGGDVMKVMVR
ncbi:MAG: leucine-rich repeat protein [Paludibacteraceae bacterium]|nr:leucine-rich repeat protein [Paludibacteraceae bacterium]